MVPGSATTTRQGTPALDLPAGAMAILRAARVSSGLSGRDLYDRERFILLAPPERGTADRTAGRRCHARRVTDRRTQLEQRLAELEQRIAAGCQAAGRERAAVTLIAVTKTFPATDVQLLAELGVSDVGENRDQEARAKHEACADLPLRWHLVGQLQRNKARSVAQYADVVHSVDRRTARRRAQQGRRRCRPTPDGPGPGVDLDPRAGSGRGGAAPDQVAGLAAAVAAAPGLLLGGVMAVAPQGEDPDAAFARLAAVAAELQRVQPQATMISAGMSGDLEAALRHGATHLRVGTALLGDRAGFRRIRSARHTGHRVIPRIRPGSIDGSGQPATGGHRYGRRHAKDGGLPRAGRGRGPRRGVRRRGVRRPTPRWPRREEPALRVTRPDEVAERPGHLGARSPTPSRRTASPRCTLAPTTRRESSASISGTAHR